ncbi:hypothetical protein V3C99_011790 [Haemonchus contortus]
MSDAKEGLMPGPQAVSRNPVPPTQPPPQKPSATYSKVTEEVSVEPESTEPRTRDEDTVGLTEEELEPYRDDPTWKSVRLVLFVLFWVLWVLLFLSAILLVIFSPGCPPRRTPTWWQTAVAYNIWVPSFQDSDGDGYGDMQGLINRLENLRKSGVQTIWPVPFLISDDYSNAIRNFEQMDPKLGVNQDADKAIESAHYNDMKFVISLPIATTSTEHDWFLKSASASLPENTNYSDFYFWRTEGGSDLLAEHKGAWYLHEKGNPKAAVLNWQNSNVRSHMFDVLSSWIDRGVDGFYLVGIEYLSRTADGSEPNWPGIADVISDIRNHVDSFVNESTKAEGKKIALFATRDEAKEKDKKQLTMNGLDSVINYELGHVSKNSEICHRSEGSVATCVHEILSDILLFHRNNPSVWPQWEFGNAWLSRLASRVDSRAHSELLIMTQLVLPGTNSYYYGDELGMKNLPNDSVVPPQRGAMQWDDSAYAGFSTKSKIPVNSDYKNINWAKQYREDQSALKMFSKLSKMRTRDESLGLGETMMGRLIDGGAYTITRFHQRDNVTDGNIYVGAVNFADHAITLPLNDLPNNDKLKKTQIVTTTSNVERYYPRQTVDFSSKSLELYKNEGIVFRYKAV